MKEPFIDVTTLIQNTQLLSDMELQAYLTSLSGSQRNDFTSSNVQAALDSVKSVKEQRFTDVNDKMLGSDNNITSAAYYLARTDDLRSMTQDIDTIAVKQLQATDINDSLVGRQNEINEWSNFNKLDTLYFMQVLFICLTFISCMLLLKTKGFISAYLFILLTTLSGIVALFALVSRVRYTSTIRDSRYWHKSRFPKQSNPFPNVPSVCPQNP